MSVSQCPHPQECFVVMRCFEVCKWLLSGYPELNRSPKFNQAQQFAEMLQLLHDVNDHFVKLEKGQEGLIKTVVEIKKIWGRSKKKDHVYQLQALYRPSFYGIDDSPLESYGVAESKVLDLSYVPLIFLVWATDIRRSH